MAHPAPCTLRWREHGAGGRDGQDQAACTPGAAACPWMSYLVDSPP
ncbi:hypothetical protein roselon_02269 [Roseibacterium elongatum DSM 19469]|uniref:Uncharacterized protein n=1 Tax=Roseicyclus elongatus DSM 19469 TaxID=1294273 RepID=W8SPZ2_9RHOB|nr:hypothetical protein roselon_02269 [Roseibacterium elongatum DSM 19469]